MKREKYKVAWVGCNLSDRDKQRAKIEISRQEDNIRNTNVGFLEVEFNHESIFRISKARLEESFLIFFPYQIIFSAKPKQQSWTWEQKYRINEKDVGGQWKLKGETRIFNSGLKQRDEFFMRLLKKLEQQLDLFSGSPRQYLRSLFIFSNKYLIFSQRIWFKKGIGPVRFEISNLNFKRTNEANIIDAKINSQSDSWWPLFPGNYWLFGWKKDFMDLLFF